MTSINLILRICALMHHHLELDLNQPHRPCVYSHLSLSRLGIVFSRLLLPLLLPPSSSLSCPPSSSIVFLPHSSFFTTSIFVFPHLFLRLPLLPAPCPLLPFSLSPTPSSHVFYHPSPVSIFPISHLV